MDGIVQVLGSKFCTGGRSIGPLIRGMRSLKSNTQCNNMPKVAFQNWIGAIENSPHHITHDNVCSSMLSCFYSYVAPTINRASYF